MKIVIVGCGKLGVMLVDYLCKEGHDVTVIDQNPGVISSISDTYDVLGVVGNGATFATLKDGGVAEADLLIASTGSDELNLLCCLIARRLGNCQTIGRVRTVAYNSEISYFKQELGLALVVNPEEKTAREIARLLRYPSANLIDSFANGNVELLKFKIGKNCPLVNMSIAEISSKYKFDVLFCVIEGENSIEIPNGNSVLKEGDFVSFLSTPTNATAFFRKIGESVGQVKSVLIVGGGAIALYLGKILEDNNIAVKIIEKNEARCRVLAEELPYANIINGDGLDRDLLIEEGLSTCGAFVPLTNNDEENVIMSLYGKTASKAKIITKLSRMKIDDVVKSLDLDCFISPKFLSSQKILKHVRAMQNSVGSNVQSLYYLADEKVEALEFEINDDSPVANIPLNKLNLKPNVIIGAITRGTEMIVPRGDDIIQPSDNVIVVTSNKGFHDIADILKD